MDEKTRVQVNKLADEVYQRLGEKLKSILLYGSAVTPRFVEGKSDINLLVVLDKVEVGSLLSIGAIIAKYKKYKFADPVVVDQDYIERSGDVFPIEFEESKRGHKIIYGSDPLANIKINPRDLRLQLERELKQSLLHLRQMLVQDPGISAHFISSLALAGKSVSAQIRGLTMLNPESEKDAQKEPVEKVEKLIGANFPALRWLIGLRHQKSAPKKPEVLNILPTLHDELGHLVRWIDELGDFQS